MRVSFARLSPALLFAFSFAIYIAAAAPTLYWLDSSEFAAAAWTLGISHPPGHPLAALWGRLFMLLPIGGLGFRVAVSQAVAGALAVATLGMLAQRALRQADLSPSLATALAFAAAGLYALTWSHAFQSVRPEVYALQAATHFGAALLTLRSLESAHAANLGGAALLVGLGLANHHVLALVGAVPLFGVAFFGRPLKARVVVLVLLGVCLGVALYLYLPLRAAAEPLVNWGHPDRWDRFLWVASARTFARAVHRGSAVPVPFEAMAQLGVLVVVSALGGLYLLVRNRATRRMGLFLLGGILCYGAAAGLIAFYPDNPDSHGYLACGLGYVAVAAVSLWGPLAGVLERRWEQATRIGCTLLVLLLVTLQLDGKWNRFDLRRAHGQERILQDAIADVAPRSVLHTRYFQTIFGLWYLRALQGLRPDLDLIHRPFLSYALPWYAPRRVLPRGRPIYEEFDLHEIEQDLKELSPTLLLYRVGLAPSREAFAAQDAAWDRLIARLWAERDDPETRKFLIWTFYLASQFRCRVGAVAEGLAMADRAERLNGTSTPELTELRKQCRGE